MSNKMSDEFKKEYIGGVELDYSFYKGEDFYSDGMVENTILDACKNKREAELLKYSTDYAVLYHLSDIRHNLLEWYPFKETDHVLEIGSGCGGVTGVLSDKCGRVTCVELSKKRSLINASRNKDRDNINIIVGNFQDIEPDLGLYDIITLIGVWEYSRLYISNDTDAFDAMLRIVKSHLSPNGHLLIAIENKMGIKYLNGAPEDHSNVQFSGVNDYINGEIVQTFSKPEIEHRLKKAGFNQYDFYYPLPDYKLPTAIYSDRYLPKPSDIRIFGQEYSSIRLSNFNEAVVYDQICADNTFSYLSNSFLISVGDEIPVVFASYQRERTQDKRIATIIHKNNNGLVVTKRSLTHEAKKHITGIEENRAVFGEGCLPIYAAEGKMQGEIYIEDFISGNTMEEDFFELRHDADAFVESFKKIKDNYLTPSEGDLYPFAFTDEFKRIFGNKVPENSRTMKMTNVDLILSNLKRQNDRVFAFDTEWCFDFPIPYDFPIWRAAKILYEKYNMYLNRKMSKMQFLTALGFTEGMIEAFENMEKNFSFYVTGDNRCEIYTERYKKRVITPQYRIY